MATDSLSTKQHRALAALLAEPTIKAAADAAGVGERTLHTWLGEEAFRTAYMEARRESVGQAIAQLQRASAGAVATLSSIADDDKKPAAARVTAARSILEFAIRAVDLEAIIERLEALEAERAERGRDA